MRNRVPTGIFAVAVLVASTACSIDVAGDVAVVHEEKRFTVSGAPELRLETFDGSVEVRSWDRDEVLVQIERRAEDSDQAQALVVNATQDGNRITVNATPPRIRREVIRFGITRSASVSLIVTAPRHVTLDAFTGDGSIRVDDLTGSVSLNSSDGSIAVSRVEGSLKAHTGDGSIRARNANGRVDVDSGDGGISVSGRFDELRANSGDGSIRIEVDNGSTMASDWSVTTGDGSILATLPATFDAEIDAHSSDGRVRADGVTQVERVDTEDDGVRAAVGNGGHVFRLRSGDGRIRIRRR